MAYTAQARIRVTDKVLQHTEVAENRHTLSLLIAIRTISGTGAEQAGI